VPSTNVTENVKQINQSVINPNLGDLQYINLILRDGSGLRLSKLLLTVEQKCVW